MIILLAEVENRERRNNLEGKMVGLMMELFKENMQEGSGFKSTFVLKRKVYLGTA